MSRRPMWVCPQCGRKFANTNQYHWCETFPLDRHFEGRPEMRALFDAFLAAVVENGPVMVFSMKTRIRLRVRMTFAGITVRRDCPIVGLVLGERVEDPRFLKIESYSPRNHSHTMGLEDPAQLDARMRERIAMSYAVGEQKHPYRS